MRTVQTLCRGLAAYVQVAFLGILLQDARDFYGDKFYDTGYMFTLS